jgi:hypothetical protein
MRHLPQPETIGTGSRSVILAGDASGDAGVDSSTAGEAAEAARAEGATIMSQDGVRVTYTKKCTESGYQDACRSTMLIGQGVARSFIKCRQCRKNREIQTQGTMQ